MSGVRAIAFHLPQFFPNARNDEWWGPGFTEWTNVARGVPLFNGHEQPNHPGELGWYDLRVPQVREQQAALAREHGIEAFCYWHYWFGGERILHEVVDEIARSGEPEFPFLVGWANQSWTGIWHGSPNRMLIEQTYPGAEDHRRHFEALLPLFADERYVRVDGRPVFYIYDPHGLPTPKETLELWRRMSEQAGLGRLFIVAEVSGPMAAAQSIREHGYDGYNQVLMPPTMTPSYNPLMVAARRATGRRFVGNRGPSVYDYERFSPRLVSSDSRALDVYPCVVPRWDNTPRSGRRGRVFQNSTPERFEDQVALAVRLVRDKPYQHRLVFIKSWNEWAETNYLEPDQRYGRAYLEATRRGLAVNRRAQNA